jgi:hypothetical protein
MAGATLAATAVAAEMKRPSLALRVPKRARFCNYGGERKLYT